MGERPAESARHSRYHSAPDLQSFHCVPTENSTKEKEPVVRDATQLCKLYLPILCGSRTCRFKLYVNHYHVRLNHCAVSY